MEKHRADDGPTDAAPHIGQPTAATPQLLIGLQLIMLAALVAGGIATAYFHRSVTSTLARQSQSLHQLSEEIAVARAESEQLRNQVGGLREYLASDTEQDIIFLKTLVIKPNIDRTLARTVAKNVHTYARLYGQDPDLVLAMIAVESAFNPTAVSHMGATGLMQVMPQWQKILGIKEELTDPEVSIKYGLQILGFYKEMYRDIETALTAYNRGPGPVDMALMRGQDPTNLYVPRVMKKYEILKGLHTGDEEARGA